MAPRCKRSNSPRRTDRVDWETPREGADWERVRVVGALSESLALLAFGANAFGQKGREAVGMSTAKTDGGAPGRRQAHVSVPASMEFLVFEDNAGEYHWTIVSGEGATLARSCGFASSEDAEQAARQIRRAAAAARFESLGVLASPVDLTARRAAKRDVADAESWLDERGALSAAAEARPPAPR